MASSPGQELELLVERPASGGRMIARKDGEVLLVAGTLPGERVLARVTHAEKRVAFASTVRVLEPSPDRREVEGDPACGGCLFAFVEYPRQLQLKAEIIRDAFTRIGRIPFERGIDVLGSPERGYRMRARFHVQTGRPGFYREGTHEWCDPRQTGQLRDGSIDALEAAIASLVAQGLVVRSVELSESIAGDQRALHVGIERGNRPDAPAGRSHQGNTGRTRVDSRVLAQALERASAAAELTGATAHGPDGGYYAAGDPIVSDPLSVVADDPNLHGALRRHPEAFFQGNRFLVAPLVQAVIASVGSGPVVDLYAGVGLFSVTLAALGHDDITAVEGDPVSSRDLQRNAAPFSKRVRVIKGSVEAYLARRGDPGPTTLIVDPPRTGISKEASQAIVRWSAERIVYVSCDAPTMARDARRLIAAGYRLEGLQGFDLFPNTPHVETVGVFAGGVRS